MVQTGITARITIVILRSKIPGPKETIHLFKDLVKYLAIPGANKYESLSNRFQMKWGPWWWMGEGKERNAETRTFHHHILSSRTARDDGSLWSPCFAAEPTKLLSYMIRKILFLSLFRIYLTFPPNGFDILYLSGVAGWWRTSGCSSMDGFIYIWWYCIAITDCHPTMWTQRKYPCTEILFIMISVRGE